MKPIGWAIIIITIIVVAILTNMIDSWAKGWQNLFFYVDDWKMWVVIAFAVWLAKKFIDWTWKAEVRLLK